MGADVMVGPIVGGIADDDAIIIIRKALRFHLRLGAATRTPLEIRIVGGLAIEGLGDRFPFHGQFVMRAITEIDNFLRVPKRE